jgi:glycosyltransferase involved in cell wall biosynthesis
MDSTICVIIPSYNGSNTIRRCVQSVLEQDLQDPYEVIVVDSSDDGTDEILRQHFPSIRLLRLPQRTAAGEARNLGVETAGSQFLAFTDADCIVSRDWLRRMLARHGEGEYTAVGGSILNGTPESFVGSAEHLFAFNEFLPQSPERLVPSMPTCNVCYRASTLAEQRFESDWPTGWASDLMLNWRLSRRQAKLLFDPTIQVTHINRTRLLISLRHQYLIGKSSCWVRKRTDLPGRFFVDHPMLAPAVSLVRMTRIALRLWQTDRTQTVRFLRLLPWVALDALAWGAGFTREALRR